MTSINLNLTNDISNCTNEEYQYLNLITNILNNGDVKTCRNGVVKSVFGISMRFRLENYFPLLTTKKVQWKIILKELLWFIRGQTNNKLLQDQNVHIWDDNSSEEFLRSQGLQYKEGILGKIYGFQWRYWGAEYDPETGGISGEYKGIDQLQEIIDKLKDPVKRYDRRLILNAWNVSDIPKMALPPCHLMSIFNVSSDGKLSCMLTQRSGDVGLGIPFNISSYAFLTCLLAHHCDLKPGQLYHTIADAHIYEEHFSSMEEQVKRTPFPFPTMKILNKYENINDYNVSDFVIEDYKSHDTIKMIMKV